MHLWIFLFLGSSFQQVGLVYTTAGKAGFITGLYVVMVPLINLIFKQAKTAASTWFGAVLACMARLVTHIPDRYEQTLRYYGWHSNKSWGMKKNGTDDTIPAVMPGEISSKESRQNWAQLIQKIYEVDPLIWPTTIQIPKFRHLPIPKSFKRWKMSRLYKFLKSMLFVLLSLVFLGSCANLPDNGARTSSKQITDGDTTHLGKAFTQVLENHSDKSGVYMLRSGLDAFIGRAVLLRLAERSIDVQYYMFHQDTVGNLLIKELIDAADRGVRVRSLLDDMYGGEADDVRLALDSHPSFEVRLFNPFVRSYSKNLQFITQLKRVNHRMHSKTFTVDNQATIVGGRNIGDEYFNADSNLAFSDRDVMAIGPVVADVSDEFDEYWNSDKLAGLQRCRCRAYGLYPAQKRASALRCASV